MSFVNPTIRSKKIGAEESNKIKSIIETLEKDPRAYDFLIPVDYIAFGLTDYPTIIKKPMDLGTLKKNMKSSKYNNVGEALDDLQLIWANCKTYNMEGSEIWKLAQNLEKLSNKLVEKNFKLNIKESKKQNTSAVKDKEDAVESVKDNDAKEESQDGGNDQQGGTQYLNLQEKIQLTEKVRKLSNEGLAAFVKYIQSECTNAFEDLDAEKVQVRVDYIDKNTYNSVMQMLDQYLKHNK